ncbi:MAG: LytTR family two component transcriptional regulator [Bacteroidetes bacterium OLB12]|nr:MAG: LytTR family two component transcriptional regulator [Bacteroidetes bacterium OLB12]
MNILIIEDEELAVTKLKKTLADVAPDAIVMGVTDSISASIQWLEENPHPDIILSDIELTDGQSFEIFRNLTVESMLIFITSYDEYAMQAFKLNSIDYLLKPVQKDELRAAIEKYRRLYGHSKTNAVSDSKDIEQLLRSFRLVQPVQYRKRFLVKSLQKLISISIEDIGYFYFEELTFFKTFDNKAYVVDYTLDEIEAMVDPETFSEPAVHISFPYKVFRELRITLVTDFL